VGKLKGLIDIDNGVERDDARIIEEVVISTSITETIDVTTCTIIIQTMSDITTSLLNEVEGTRMMIKNTSGGDNILNITIEGNTAPTIYNGEGFNMVFNGTDWDLL